MSRLSWWIGMALLVTGACGGGDSPQGADAAPGGGKADAGPPATADAAPPAEPDAGEKEEPDAGPQACVVPTGGYGDLAALALEAELFEGDVFAAAELDGSAAPDLLFVDLRAGQGVFAGGPVKVGTFELTGVEASFETCGACVSIFGDFGDDGPLGSWMASAGTLTLTSVEGRLTGTLENVTFRHVDLESGAPLDDRCDTSIAKATFDAPIAPEEPRGP